MIKWKAIQFKFTPQNCHAYFTLLKIDWYLHLKEMPCSEISENRYNSSLLHQIGTQWIKWKPIYQVYPQHCHAYFALKWTDILHLKEMSCSELSENSFNSSLLHKIVMLIFLYLKLTDILHLKEMSCSDLSENSFNSSLLHKIVMLISLCLKLKQNKFNANGILIAPGFRRTLVRNNMTEINYVHW